MGFAVVKNKRSQLIWRFRLARRLIRVVQDVRGKIEAKVVLKGRVMEESPISAKIVDKVRLKARIWVR